MNPFVVGTYISKEYFCDRRAETRSLEEHIRNGRNVVLFSERRMGKTGLIQHVFHDPQIQKEFHCLYFDAFTCGTFQEFAFALVNSIFRSLKTENGFLEKTTSCFSSLGLRKSANPNNGSPVIFLSLGDIQEPEKTIEEAFSYLDSLDRPVILAIDEFPKIIAFKEKDAAALLRGIIQTKRNIRMIYSGSASHLLSELFLPGRSPFYQSASVLHLNPIAEKEYFLFVEEKFRASGKTIPKAIFHRVYAKFSGCTWYIQLVFNRVYSETQGGVRSA